MKSINRIQTKDYIANILKKEILYNRIKDGEELVQETIASKLGVSRMPVREAFQILEMEGFVERLPNRHVVVRGVTPKIIYEIFALVEHIQIGFIQDIFNLEKDYLDEFHKNILQYKAKQIDEIMLHSFFSQVLDNLYVNLLHKKLLDGYVNFVLEDLGLSGSNEIAIWDDVENALSEQDEKSLRELFHGYFIQLAKTMIKEVLKENG